MAGERRSGVFDQLVSGVADAVADVRAKLIDEGWFGRRAAPPSQFDGTDLGWREPSARPEGVGSARDRFAMPRPTFEEMWATREGPPDRDERDREADLER